MSFNPEVQVEEKLFARLNASPIVPAAQSAWNTQAPPGTQIEPGSKPLIIFTMISADFSVGSFEKNAGEIFFQVSVYDDRTNGYANISDVVGKIRGDSEGTDNNPTYGLHRWLITGMTDTADCRMELVSAFTQHEADSFHYASTFKVTATEA